MNDSTEDILTVQHRIFLSKPLEERILMALEMVEDGFKFCENNIKNAHPGISGKELKARIFSSFYSDDFSEEELNNIIQYLVK